MSHEFTHHQHFPLHKKIAASVIAAGLIILTAPAVRASARQLYTTDGVNIRAKADSTSRICKVVSAGTLVTELDQKGNWIKVKTDDDDKVSGYIYKSYLSKDDPSYEIETEESGTTEEEKIRDQVISYARTRIGDSYSQKKRDQKGFADCSSLVRDSYEDATGICIGDTTVTQTEAMEKYLYPIKSLYEVHAGDLVYHLGKKNNHTGIYLGQGKVLHASMSSGKVKVSSFDEKSDYWDYGCDAVSYCESNQ